MNSLETVTVGLYSMIEGEILYHETDVGHILMGGISKEDGNPIYELTLVTLDNSVEEGEPVLEENAFCIPIKESLVGLVFYSQIGFCPDMRKSLIQYLREFAPNVKVEFKINIKKDRKGIE